MFLRNQWYVAAWDHEIGGAPFARTICNERIVFFRKPDRTLVALEDICPHRLAPLSKGRVDGDRIVCGYHGLAFDGCGTCVDMPNEREPNPNVRVKSYPVAERDRYVWIWIGDAALADESTIPGVPHASEPGWVFDGQTYHMRCDYRLLIDNLMDLSHETYVHPNSIGQHEIMESPIKTTTDGDTVAVSRWMLNITPPPFWSTNLKSKEPCDRWQICTFTLPSTVNIDVGVALAGTGAPDGDRANGSTGIVTGYRTPDTETTCWYHWGMVRNFETEDHGLTLRIRDAQAGVFNEDVEMIEAQQANMLAHPDRRLMDYNIDSGGARARRIIQKAIRKLEEVPGMVGKKDREAA